MKNNKPWDIIIIGGSYSGLAAAMALGRSLRKVLLIDSGIPCNRQTPHSHNFITQDGVSPQQIAAKAREQVRKYDTIEFLDGLATNAKAVGEGFEIEVSTGQWFTSRKLVMATGIKDIMPAIPGFAECWGISALHCPYCHGYEVRNKKTGIIGNGIYGYEFGAMISNWTKDLALYTNGPIDMLPGQKQALEKNQIEIIEKPIAKLDHINGHIQSIQFTDGSSTPVEALYAKPDFVQSSGIPQMQGCEINLDGHIVVDALQQTNVPGVYACGDNSSRMRTVANAVSTGTTAGMMLNKEMIMENF